MVSSTHIPAHLAQAAGAWERAGRPAQASIPWSRAAWIRGFPDRQRLLTALPDELDRGALVTAATRIRNSRTALDAFLVTMAWGFGFTGYGPFRVQRMLHANGGAEQLGEELWDIADECREEGGLAAFRAIARRRARHHGYLSHLGPGLGTRYLYACTAVGAGPANPATPIMDGHVRDWFVREVDVDLVIGRWHSPSYQRYLDLLRAWGDELGLTADEVEALVFADQAARTGSPWAPVWLSTPPR